ncbi:hypothetical protein [Alteromonas abrolhosensis]|uniref:hypothetical protein n=1 Tax=Alteromonas abrolhosensis TaxID=1892904 RepID=UPI000D5259E7|nr:hypothetical protein [Alteromonas abrolhosensis]
MKYLQEAIICFFLGGIPCLWSFSDNGIAGVEAFYKSIDASDRTVIYFFILAAFHLLASLAWYWSSRWHDGLKATLKNILPVANGVGSSLLCIYRIIAGASMACVFILLANFTERESYEVMAGLAISSLVFLLMSYFVNKTFDYANEKQKVGS